MDKKRILIGTGIGLIVLGLVFFSGIKIQGFAVKNNNFENEGKKINQNLVLENLSNSQTSKKSVGPNPGVLEYNEDIIVLNAYQSKGEKGLIYQTLYPRFVYEEGKWKEKEKAKSLMNKTGFSVVFEKIDEDFNVEIIDFNYTSVKFCLTSNIKNKDIPLKQFNYENVFDEKENKTKKDKKYEEFKLKGNPRKNYTIRFIGNSEKCFTITQDKVLGKNFQFGFNTTYWSYQEDPSAYSTIGTWIDESNLYDGSWSTAANGSWQTSGGSYPRYYSNWTLPAGFSTGMIQAKAHAYDLGFRVDCYNYSYEGTKWVLLDSDFAKEALETTNFTIPGDCVSSGEPIYMRYIPYATYTGLFYEDAMWWNSTCACPAGQSLTAWEVDCTQNCSLTEDCDLGHGTTVHLIGSGSFNINANLSGVNGINIIGDSCEARVWPSGNIIFDGGSVL